MRESSDQAELAALLHPSEPAAPPPAASAPASPLLAAKLEPAVELDRGPASFSIDEISTAVRYWGDHLEDKGAAKVSGGFGPNACLVIEVLTLMSVNRERTVACKSGSKLAQVVNEALQASPSREPTEHPADAVA
ncbi:hypothetical protein [Variovorax sp. LjRoot178]|uniref:hypothetical protein n=1 Tax=Variovorax sp. LjRoot178 TaxID=3342277 RepID=UPI003ECCC38C